MPCYFHKYVLQYLLTNVEDAIWQINASLRSSVAEQMEMKVKNELY